MVSTEIAARSGVEILPTSADPRGWSPQAKKLMEFVGLAVVNPQTGAVHLPAPGVAEAFLSVCRRTGLDPFAKQIYAMQAGGKWSIVVGVDGFRIIAQRSKGYRGQIGPQWSTGRTVQRPMVVGGQLVVHNGEAVMVDELEWVDAWLPETFGLAPDAKPYAARVGILRDGFAEPLWQVATWAEFGMEPRYTGDNWGVRPAHMLGIRAETHGLRRTFPNDLSGLYTPEDFDAMDHTDADAEQLIAAQIKQVQAITDKEELARQFHAWNSTSKLHDSVRAAFMTQAGTLELRAAEAAGDGTAPGGPETGTEPAESDTEPAGPDTAGEETAVIVTEPGTGGAESDTAPEGPDQAPDDATEPPSDPDDPDGWQAAERAEFEAAVARGEVTP